MANILNDVLRVVTSTVAAWKLQVSKKRMIGASEGTALNPDPVIIFKCTYDNSSYGIVSNTRHWNLAGNNDPTTATTARRGDYASGAAGWWNLKFGDDPLDIDNWEEVDLTGIDLSGLIDKAIVYGGPDGKQTQISSFYYDTTNGLVLGSTGSALPFKADWGSIRAEYGPLEATFRNDTSNVSLSVNAEGALVLNSTNLTGNRGGIDIKSGAKYLVGGVEVVPTGCLKQTGFDNPDNAITTYDSATRIVTVSGTAKLYYQGVMIKDLSVGNIVSVAHGSGTGIYYYYYDGSNYVWSNTVWTFDKAQIAAVHYNTNDKFGLRETHSVMPFETHRELHQTVGTYLVSGGSIGGFTLASTTASERRPSIAQSIVADEDLVTTLPALADNGPYTVLHVGASNASTFTLSSADIVALSGNNPQVNNPATGALTNISNNDYMNVFVLAIPVTSDTNSQIYRFAFVNGQYANASIDLVNAQNPGTIVLGDIASAINEMVYIGRILIRYQAGNWTIEQVSAITGTRFNQFQGQAVSTLPYSSIIGSAYRVGLFDVNSRGYTTSNITIDSNDNIVSLKSIKSSQLTQIMQSNNTTNGAISFDASLGGSLLLTGGLTGAITITITNALVGNPMKIFFTQGSSAQAVNISALGVGFYQSGYSGVKTAIVPASISTVSAIYILEITYVTGTVAMMVIL